MAINAQMLNELVADVRVNRRGFDPDRATASQTTIQTAALLSILGELREMNAHLEALNARPT